MSSYSVVEELFDKHYRVLRVDEGSRRIYSIDYYIRLPKPPQCHDTLSIDNVTLCYIKLGLCEIVVSIVDEIIELINAKLIVDVSKDLTGGSPAKAREICLTEISKFLEVL